MTGPKSSYELAMERLKKQEADAGIERQPVTEAQKAAIAEARSFYGSKLAEIEVLHQGRMRLAMDPGERLTLEDQYRRDRERLTSEQESKIRKIRDER